MALQLGELRALFARSGNRCAFPECAQRLIDTDNLFVGQICHIEAQSPGGPRYNPTQSDEQRDNSANLLLLCYPHHRRVDSDANLYNVEWLRNIKQQHENAYRAHPFELEEGLAAAILTETHEYWRRLHVIQRTQEEQYDMAMGVNPDASFAEVLTSLRELLVSMDHLFGQASGDYDAAGGGASPWEARNIFFPNAMQLSKLYLKQLEVQFLSCQLRLEPANAALQASFEEAKAQLIDLVTHSGYAD